MVGTTKVYLLACLCVVTLVLWTPNKYAYTTPQFNELIDDRLIFNSTITQLSRQLDSTFNRITAKKDTIVQQTQELERITHKARTNEIPYVGPGRTEYRSASDITNEELLKLFPWYSEYVRYGFIPY